MLMADRACTATNEAGQPCRQAPLQGDERCFWHTPATAQEAAEARRLGGANKKREHTLSAVYEFGGLETVGDALRLFEIAAFEAMALPQGPMRCRILIQAGLAGLRGIEAADHEERLQQLEAAIRPRLAQETRTSKRRRGWWR